jgi:hypothetical protein
MGRAASTVKVMLANMQNHLWPRLFGATGYPSDREQVRQYWAPTHKHMNGILEGRGGPGGALGAEAARKASKKARRTGWDEHAAEAAGQSARKLVAQALMAATATTTTREHLCQSGTYLLQDSQLAEIFSVNAARVLLAYIAFACQTGCRTGMAVNVAEDETEESGLWAGVPPLTQDDVTTGRFSELILLHGGALAQWYMDIIFARVKGHYFAHMAFGTSVTPDSDEMVRLATAALLRLLLATGAPRAVYSGLEQRDVVALRHKIDSPHGFPGLRLADTTYTSWDSLVQACFNEEWVLEASAESDGCEILVKDLSTAARANCNAGAGSTSLTFCSLV